ncbi:cytidine deaminase [soil metagenome]
MDQTRLIEAARAASSRAYAPYSNFRVGAALVTANGEIHTGCNVENASYGLSMCAERAAVFAMSANATDEDDRKIRLVAVVSPDAAPCLPCGACRQVLWEFGCEEVVVEEGSGIRRYPFGELLPHAFGPEAL